MTKRKPEGLQPVINKHNKQEQICPSQRYAIYAKVSQYMSISSRSQMLAGWQISGIERESCCRRSGQGHWERDKFVKILRFSVQDAARNATSYLWTAWMPLWVRCLNIWLPNADLVQVWTHRDAYFHEFVYSFSGLLILLLSALGTPNRLHESWRLCSRFPTDSCQIHDC